MPSLRRQRGDTIIEVMVALAVLGLAFAISYATASRSLNVAQNSQEHSQASQVLKSQVELAHNNSSDSSLYTEGKWFCLYYSSSQGKISIADYPSNSVSSAPPECQSQLNASVNYVTYVTYTCEVQVGNGYQSCDASGNSGLVKQNYFTFTVAWPGIGNLGPQQEQINYKLDQVNNYTDLGGTSGGLGGGLPTCAANQEGTWPNCYTQPSIIVVVKKIAPDPGNVTPSCSKAATDAKAGTIVGLFQAGALVANQTTDISSSTTFNGLSVGNYQIQIRGVPSGYEACPPVSVSASTSMSGATVVTTLKIRPKCNQVYTQTGSTETYGIVGYSSVPVYAYGIIGYQSESYQVWGVVGYGYQNHPYWGVTGHQYVVTGGYWVYYNHHRDRYWINTYTYEPIYGWVDDWVYGPIYGWVTEWESVPIYGNYIAYWETIAQYGWTYTPVYGYVNQCPN